MTAFVPRVESPNAPHSGPNFAPLMEEINKALMLGWYKTPPSLDVLNPAISNRWTVKINRAYLDLAKLDLGPNEPVYIVEANPETSAFSTSSGMPAVCTAVGRLAAQRIAEGSHRLATAEECARCQEEQRTREKQCEEIEKNNPENRKRQPLITPEAIAALRAISQEPERPAAPQNSTATDEPAAGRDAIKGREKR